MPFPYWFSATAREAVGSALNACNGSHCWATMASSESSSNTARKKWAKRLYKPRPARKEKCKHALQSAARTIRRFRRAKPLQIPQLASVPNVTIKGRAEAMQTARGNTQGLSISGGRWGSSAISANLPTPKAMFCLCAHVLPEP